MNLLLLFPSDLRDNNVVRISDHRLQHILLVHRASVGDSIRVGMVDGLIGSGIIEQLNEQSAEIRFTLDTPPPPKKPLRIILALPRPKMLKRILQTITSMGVEELYLINSYRVEKSFWQTPILSEQGLLEQLTLGLEQSRDTQLPKIELRKRFKPFVEDELPDLIENSYPLVAHPGVEAPIPHSLNKPCTLAVGPEGGFIPYEISKFKEVGFNCGHMGPNILRVETAIPALIASLYNW
ncbi:16S rRNA (uracil(1498)-N(3))-methyltransferase [uncultured Umboniibacter sp.]|uniref:16S rRNA (uracil(1498)-N(3))-methyltransferase n=1 Tax=uncultured Umboniibacter sp. TaxID=1798917 RepID=UPI00261FE02A|nr:16S rRNA (uracil(1498)-N(3))-methyltransferase [uncultured Umboniibacter sp.]